MISPKALKERATKLIKDVYKDKYEDGGLRKFRELNDLVGNPYLYNDHDMFEIYEILNDTKTTLKLTTHINVR